MRNDHIINLIEERPIISLSAAEIERVNAHTAGCAECRLAFEAAMVSSRLLRERAEVAVEPSPFFQTRVMAAIRERNAAPEAFGILKLWLSARILITSMAAVVVMLTALTLLSGSNTDMTTGPGAEETELSVFDDDGRINEDLTYGQVLTNLYDQEAEGSDGRQQ